jgi:hypothetical protein
MQAPPAIGLGEKRPLLRRDRLGQERFGCGIDGRRLRPLYAEVRHQAPAQEIEGALAGRRIAADDP